MSRSIRFSIFTLLLGMFLIAGGAGCTSPGKTMCQRDNTYNKKSSVRNRTNYKSRYAMKSQPVKKDYVVRNKRTGKKY